MVGCGPYRFGKIDEDAQTFTLEAVEDHYAGEVNVKEILVRSYDTQEAITLALKNKEIDCYSDYSRGLVAYSAPALNGIEGLNLGSSQNPGNLQLLFGSNVFPTNDLAFRNAVSYSLNHELIAMTVGGEEGMVPGRGVISPGNKGFDSSIPSLTQDTEKANQILDEAGYQDVNNDGLREAPDGSALDVLITVQTNVNKTELFLRIAEIIQSDLAEVGIKVTLDEETLSNWDAYKQFVYTDGMYQLYINNNTSGIARYKTAYFYVEDKYSVFGTWGNEELITLYDAMINAHSLEAYNERVKELQKYNDENTLAIALGWDNVYFPYWTDKYDGWVNFTGTGCVNYRTWYNLYTK